MFPPKKLIGAWVGGYLAIRVSLGFFYFDKTLTLDMFRLTGTEYLEKGIDGNAYDKFNVPKKLQDCMLPVIEMAHE